MGCEGIRGRTGARAWEVIHIYTGSFTPSPDPIPLLPPPDLDKEGRVDNQRDTPPNTRLTVQPIRATSPSGWRTLAPGGSDLPKDNRALEEVPRMIKLVCWNTAYRRKSWC